jgi:hypothetical protein
MNDLFDLNFVTSKDNVKLEGFYEVLRNFNMEPKEYKDMTDEDWNILWKLFVNIRML